MYESLKESWLVQELTQEACEEAKLEAREAELKRQEHLLQETQRLLQDAEHLEIHRQLLLSFISARFPGIISEAVKQAYAIKDPAILQSLLTSLFTAEVQEEALQLLLNWANTSEKRDR